MLNCKKSQSSPDIFVEETVIDTTEESDSTETLVDQNDSVDSVYYLSFILNNNTEALQTPLRKSQGRKINNEEEIKKLAFRLNRIKNLKNSVFITQRILRKILP